MPPWNVDFFPNIWEERKLFESHANENKIVYDVPRGKDGYIIRIKESGKVVKTFESPAHYLQYYIGYDIPSNVKEKRSRNKPKMYGDEVFSQEKELKKNKKDKEKKK